MQISTVRCPVTALLFLALAAGATAARSQVVPSAYARGLSISAGGEVSGFQPDYAGHGVPEAAPFSGYLAGMGTYVDVKFTPWVQIEAEGRWMRFNRPDGGIYEDNYLVGPRLPIYKLHFWRATPYGKFLDRLRQPELRKRQRMGPLYQPGLWRRPGHQAGEENQRPPAGLRVSAMAKVVRRSGEDLHPLPLWAQRRDFVPRAWPQVGGARAAADALAPLVSCF